jgi:hypothetical protein
LAPRAGPKKPTQFDSPQISVSGDLATTVNRGELEILLPVRELVLSSLKQFLRQNIS